MSTLFVSAFFVSTFFCGPGEVWLGFPQEEGFPHGGGLRVRFGEAGFPTEVHRTTVGLRWGLLRRVRYGAVDTWSSDEGFPLQLR